MRLCCMFSLVVQWLLSTLGGDAYWLSLQQPCQDQPGICPPPRQLNEPKEDLEALPDSDITPQAKENMHVVDICWIFSGPWKKLPEMA